jgi:acyl-coenzyme A synthetase/AMP-(fatty) acid ligase
MAKTRICRLFMDAYGSTQVGIGVLGTAADLRRVPETVGKPVVDCPVRIFDGNDKRVGPHATGRPCDVTTLTPISG